MSDHYDQPITQWIRELHCEQPEKVSEAQRKLFDAYSQRLYARARAALGTQLARRVEPESVALSAICSFLRTERTDLADREALWRYLVRLVLRKVFDRRRRHVGAQRRSISREQDAGDGEAQERLLESGRAATAPVSQKRGYQRRSPGGAEATFDEQDMLDLLSEGPGPLEAAMVLEMLELLSDTQRQIVLRKFTGDSDTTIAQSLGVSSRTVTRGVQEIRKHWERFREDEPPADSACAQ